MADFRVIVLLLCLLVALPAQADDSLERIRVLAKGGATQLALKLVERGQPDPAEGESWMEWEKARFEIYTTREDWDAIARRARALPPRVPPEFRQWARVQAAWARLQAGDGAGARLFLRKLLWGEPPGTRKQRARWRRWVIRSYLLEGRVHDAQTALLRYKQDFRARGAAWQQLHARVLLQAGNPKAAFDVLAGIQSFEGRGLRLLAGLRGKLYTPAEVLSRSMTLAQATREKPRAHRLAWAVAAEAARWAGDPPKRVLATEWVLTLAEPGRAADPLITLKADHLWRAYLVLADRVGNARRLLVGDDEAWLKQAESYTRDEAHRARAFYAFLSQQARSPELRREAHQRLTASLYADGRAMLVRQLYTESRRFPGVEDIPPLVRQRIALHALKGYDIDLAARMVQGMTQPPEGEDPDRWALSQSRILVYAGSYEAAYKRLQTLLAAKTTVSDEFADQYIQVLFDLQTVGRHKEAVSLFRQVFERNHSKRIRRQLFYWIADSQAALGEYILAAESYLRSAVYGHPTGGDIWGQTARFHAAEAMAKAGLTADARNVYRLLLKHTRDPRQRALIQRNLQQLWLHENPTTTP